MNADSTPKKQSERRTGLIVGAVFALAALYVVQSYVRFHMAEHGEIRYDAGRAELCSEIKAKRPVIHKALTADKFC